MKKFLRRLFVVPLLVCGMSAPVQAMDTQAILSKADQISSSGENPEEALQLYRSVAENGQDPLHIILSKLKIATLLDEQLLRYEEAIQAYRAFEAEYPENRLAKITVRRAQRLEQLQAEGLLQDYREFKLLEQRYFRSPAENKALALEFYHLALDNRTKRFADELITRAVDALIQHRLYFKADHLVKQSDSNFVPSDFWAEEISEGIQIFWMVLISRITIVLCLLLIAVGKGFKQVIPMVKAKKRPLLILTAVLCLFLTIYSLITKKYDPDMEWRFLLLVLGQSLLLIPFSLALCNSLSFVKNQIARTILTGILGILLGLSAWVLFMDHVNFLLVDRV